MIVIETSSDRAVCQIKGADDMQCGTDRVWRRPCRLWESRENHYTRSRCSWWRPPCASRTRRARRTWVWSASRSPWGILVTRRWISAAPAPRDADALLCRLASPPGSPSAPTHGCPFNYPPIILIPLPYIAIIIYNTIRRNHDFKRYQ